MKTVTRRRTAEDLIAETSERARKTTKGSAQSGFRSRVLVSVSFVDWLLSRSDLPIELAADAGSCLNRLPPCARRSRYRLTHKTAGVCIDPGLAGP